MEILENLHTKGRKRRDKANKQNNPADRGDPCTYEQPSVVGIQRSKNNDNKHDIKQYKPLEMEGR